MDRFTVVVRSANRINGAITDYTVVMPPPPVPEVRGLWKVTTVIGTYAAGYTTYVWEVCLKAPGLCRYSSTNADGLATAAIMRHTEPGAQVNPPLYFNAYPQVMRVQISQVSGTILPYGVGEHTLTMEWQKLS